MFGPERRDDDDDDDDHHNGDSGNRHRGHDDDDDDDDGDHHGSKDRRAQLYIQMGDNGRRGQMQNLEHGGVPAGVPDDQFGGPEPDNTRISRA